ncbi:hypothetical protein [Endozoicomonas sp. 8E]|uniref:hypothetical protein n=1 Tax=Endozoicomonas sp. 8E TaxID=3035692 RepID=UPI002938E581|nr:hypothetical protein [Endozoicomonas sp. 8E]WOG27767.1 hypothetical protein P6910_25005 [Endozoicomonas sp. 8E]
MFCRTCDYGKLTSPPPSPSSTINKDLKRSAARMNATEATDDELPAHSESDSSPFRIWVVSDENEDLLNVQVEVSDGTVDAFERKDGNAYAKSLAKVLAQNMAKIARNLKVNRLDISFKEEHHCHKKKERRDHQHLHESLAFFIHHFQKQLEMQDHQELHKSLTFFISHFKQMEVRDQLQEQQQEMMQKLHQAALYSGALEKEKMPIHEKAIAMTRERATKIDPSQWPNLSGVGMTLLLSIDYQNDLLMMDLTSVFQAIQEGNMVQLLVTQTVSADEGNQAAAGTTKLYMLGAIIPAPDINSDTVSTDMHLLIGTQQPLHVNQQNLTNILIAAKEVAGEYEHGADLSLYFFLSSQINIQDNEDPLSSIPNIEHSINRNLPGSALSPKL